MRAPVTLLCAFLAGSALFAQPRILDVHPAGDPAGKLLTMEDVILNRAVIPENRYFRWKDDNTYAFFKDGKWETSEALPGQTVTEASPWKAFSKGNSLFITDGADTTAVALSDRRDLVFGQSVSRNEFGIDGGVFWSPDRTKLAFYRKDESRVTDFPLLDIKTRTGSLVPIKYPMNGMDSELISLGVYDRLSGKTIYLDVKDFSEERYLTNISWSPDGRVLYVQVVDRSQHHMRLNRYDARTGAFVRTLLTEDNKAWIEPLDPVRFLEGREDLMVYRTDNRDGYRNLYLVDTLGTIRRLTAVDADVAYVGNDGKYVYYTSAEISPVENHLFRIPLTVRKGRKPVLERVKAGAPERLTTERGWHDIAMNDGCSLYIDSWSNLNVPRVTDLHRADGRLVRNLLTAGDPLEDYAACEVDFGTIPSADGLYDNYFRLIKPLGFDPSRKYPLILYVYGGPHSQLVQDSWLGQIRMWEMLMAQKGYVVYIQDNRGTQNRGAAFEKAINRQCGRAEMADQMVGIDWLRNQPWIDGDRIGVHGWSYGGFMTISLMTHYPEVFKVGVAGGPVIDWKWYEIMYGERYMDNPETNPEGFAKTSLIGKAKDLQGKLLICQGAIDNTVVWEHSLSFIEECIQENIQVDYFPYPTHEHNVRGRNRVHLMDKVTLYFEDYL